MWRSIGRHLSLAHHVTALVNLTHQPHGRLLSLVMLRTSRWHAVLLRRRLLVHHGTLIWLHIHVWSGTIVSHWLPLTHCHLVLHGHALGRWHRMVVASHGAVATRRHIHGAVRHAELTGSRSLHWHMVRPFKEKRSERTVRLRVTEVHGTGLLIITELAAEAAS